MGQEDHGWAIASEFPAVQLWYHFSRKAFETFVLPSVTILTQCCWFELFMLGAEMPRQLNTRHTLESISCNMWCRPEKFTSISNSTKLCTEAKVHLAQEGVVCHTPGEAYAQLSPKTKLENLGQHLWLVSVVLKNECTLVLGIMGKEMCLMEGCSTGA